MWVSGWLCASVAFDGQVCWWDARRLHEPVDRQPLASSLPSYRIMGTGMGVDNAESAGGSGSAVGRPTQLQKRLSWRARRGGSHATAHPSPMVPVPPPPETARSGTAGSAQALRSLEIEVSSPAQVFDVDEAAPSTPGFRRTRFRRPSTGVGWESSREQLGLSTSAEGSRHSPELSNGHGERDGWLFHGGAGTVSRGTASQLTIGGACLAQLGGAVRLCRCSHACGRHRCSHGMCSAGGF